MYQHLHHRRPRGTRENERPEKVFEEIIVKNIPNMGKETLTYVEEVQRMPYKINPRRNTARHILIKLTKIMFREKILRAIREKQQITYKSTPIRITVDFKTETASKKGEARYI